MTVLFAHFSGRAENIDYPTVEKYTFSQGVHVPDINMQTTVQNVKDYISKCTKIPTDHIFLTIGNGLGVKQEVLSNKRDLTSGITEKNTRITNWSYSNGSEPTYSPNDDESILEAMKPKPSENGAMPEGKPILYFSAKRCVDLTHCPNVVRLRTLWIKAPSYTISGLCPDVHRIPYTNDMSVSQLKDAITAKTGIEWDRYTLAWPYMLVNPPQDETTMEAIKIKEEDGSILACLKEKKSEPLLSEPEFESH